eukprot:gene50716-32000_t
MGIARDYGGVLCSFEQCAPVVVFGATTEQCAPVVVFGATTEQCAPVVVFGATTERPSSCADACRCALSLRAAKRRIARMSAQLLAGHARLSESIRSVAPLAASIRSVDGAPSMPPVGGLHQGVEWNIMLAGEIGTRDIRSFGVVGPALASVRQLANKATAVGADILCNE